MEGMIEVLLLGIAISIASVLTFPAQANMQTDGIYEYAMLDAVLNHNEDYNLTISDMLNFYFCDGMFSEISNKMSDALNKTVKDDYNYIFYGVSENSMIHLYNNQPDVCAKKIDVINIRTKCMNVSFGMWPSWKNYTRAC